MGTGIRLLDTWRAVRLPDTWRAVRLPHTSRAVRLPDSSRAGLLAALLAIAGCAGAAGQPPAPPRQLAYQETARLFEAPGGLRVVIRPDSRTNLVAVDVRFDVGAADDPPGRAGLAHLVEHLRFAMKPRDATPGATAPNAADAPNAAATIAARLRAISLGFNARTDWHTTHYSALAPADQLAALIALERARLDTGCDSITDADVDRERRVVLAELAQRRAAPGGALRGVLLTAVYPPGHPYARPIGGDPASLAAITRDDVCAFLARHYRRDRATFVVVGRVSFDLVRLLLGGPARGAPARAADADALIPPADTRGDATLRLDADRHADRHADQHSDQPMVLAPIALPPRGHPDALAAALVADALGAAIARKRRGAGPGPMSAVRGGVTIIGGDRAPVALAWVSVSRTADLDGGEALLRDAFATTRRAIDALGPDDAAELIASFRHRRALAYFDQFERLTARGALLADAAADQRRPGLVRSEIARLDALTIDDARRIAARLRPRRVIRLISSDGRVQKSTTSTKKRRAALPAALPAGSIDSIKMIKPIKTIDSISGNHPTDPHADAYTQDPDTPAEPVARPPPTPMSSRAPQIRDVTLDNGLRVLLVSDTAMPVVDVRLLVDVGTADAHDSPGLAYAAAHKLRPRVGRDTDPGDLAVLREVGRRARAFLPDVGPRTTAFRLRGLATHVDLLVRALALFVPQGDYAGAPADPPPPPIPPARTAYERYRRAFRAAVFGADHPAARPPGGAPVRATIAALRAFAARHYRPDNAVLIVVGRFDADLALAHARRWFGSWSRGDRVAPRPTSTPSTRAPGPVYLGFDTDDDSIELRIGFPVASGVDARFPVRQVLARLLARRLAAVRDQLGASYGLTARRLPDVGADLLAIEGRLDGARAGQALALILAALDALRAGGDTFAADVARARRAAVRELAAAPGDSASIATRLAFVAEHGLPLDFHDRLVARVAAVTADDVLALIGAELAADRVTVGLSGSRTLIDRAYATAGVRGVRHVD